MVEKNHVIFFLARHLQRLLPGFRRVNADLRALQQVPDDGQVHRCIIRHEDLRSGCDQLLMRFSALTVRLAECRRQITDRRPVHDLLLQVKHKLRAPAVFALHLQLRSHEIQELSGNAHAETCALDRPVPLLVDPLEGGKKLLHVFLFDADARILHAHMQFHVVLIELLRRHRQCDRSRLRVLDGIGQDVRHHLFDADFIADHHMRKLLSRSDDQLQTLVRRALPDHVDQIVQHGRGIILDGDDLHLAGFDLGKIKDVIDNAKQTSSRAPEILRIPDDALFRGLTQDHLIHAKNRVDRRADLMRHIGQEEGFRTVRRLRLLRHLQVIFIGLLKVRRDRFEEICQPHLHRHRRSPVLQLHIRKSDGPFLRNGAAFTHCQQNHCGIHNAAVFSPAAADARLQRHILDILQNILAHPDFGSVPPSEKGGAVAALKDNAYLRLQCQHLLRRLPRFLQKALHRRIAELHRVSRADITDKVEISVRQHAQRCPGDQHTVPFQHERKAADIFEEIRIRICLQIADVGFDGRTPVDRLNITVPGHTDLLRLPLLYRHLLPERTESQAVLLIHAQLSPRKPDDHRTGIMHISAADKGAVPRLVIFPNAGDAADQGNITKTGIYFFHIAGNRQIGAGHQQDHALQIVDPAEILPYFLQCRALVSAVQVIFRDADLGLLEKAEREAHLPAHGHFSAGALRDGSRREPREISPEHIIHGPVHGLRHPHRAHKDKTRMPLPVLGETPDDRCRLFELRLILHRIRYLIHFSSVCTISRMAISIAFCPWVVMGMMINALSI